MQIYVLYQFEKYLHIHKKSPNGFPAPLLSIQMHNSPDDSLHLLSLFILVWHPL